MDSIVKQCTQNKNLSNGSIILMYNGAKYTPEALEGVITKLRGQGYDIVPVSTASHLKKAQERLVGLNRLVEKGNLGLNDLDIAEALISDSENALNLFK